MERRTKLTEYFGFDATLELLATDIYTSYSDEKLRVLLTLVPLKELSASATSEMLKRGIITVKDLAPESSL